MSRMNLHIPQQEINQFCRRWNVEELAVFGSAGREDFGLESDVDLLVTFAPEAGIDLFDIAQMHIELEGLFGRPVDLIEKAALENPYRRAEILKTSQVIYAAERA